jgi:hypothetical protein
MNIEEVSACLLIWYLMREKLKMLIVGLNVLSIVILTTNAKCGLLFRLLEFVTSLEWSFQIR